MHKPAGFVKFVYNACTMTCCIHSLCKGLSANLQICRALPPLFPSGCSFLFRLCKSPAQGAAAPSGGCILPASKALSSALRRKNKPKIYANLTKPARRKNHARQISLGAVCVSQAGARAGLGKNIRRSRERRQRRRLWDGALSPPRQQKKPPRWGGFQAVEKGAPFSTEQLRPAAAQELSAKGGPFPRLRAEKSFRPRTCRGRKRILLGSRRLARTLRGFLTVSNAAPVGRHFLRLSRSRTAAARSGGRA